jgi:hypothetical protein
MRHSQTSRISAKTLLAVVGFGLLGACADSVSAPTAEITAKAPAGYNKVVGVTTFVYTPGQGVTKRFGDHMIVIPAGAICDLGSSYGLGQWDKPCTASTKSIVITALSFQDADGHPYVDFQPALRFVPTKQVFLYMRDGVRDGSHEVSIFYCATPVSCTDEAKTDPTLATKRIGHSRILYRRLKHFSGYSVANAQDCTDGVVQTLDDGTLFCNTDGLRGGDSRNGYVVATGLGKTSTGDTFGRRRRADK